MKAKVILVGGGAVAAFAVIRDGARAAAPELHVIVPAVIIGTIILGAVSLALIRGMHHSTVIRWQHREQEHRELPPAAEFRPLPPAVTGRIDPFTADDTRPWELAVEEADRAELSRQGPREARPVQDPCEGPGCGNALDEYAWEAELEPLAEGGEPETHRFCSKECTEAWRERYRAAALPRAARRNR